MPGLSTTRPAGGPTHNKGGKLNQQRRRTYSAGSNKDPVGAAGRALERGDLLPARCGRAHEGAVGVLRGNLLCVWGSVNDDWSLGLRVCGDDGQRAAWRVAGGRTTNRAICTTPYIHKRRALNVPSSK